MGGEVQKMNGCENKQGMDGRVYSLHAYKMSSRLKCVSIFKISSYKQNYQDAFSKI